MKKTLLIVGLLTLSLTFGCASGNQEDVLQSAADAVSAAENASDCAEETYNSAKKVLKEAQDAAASGNMDLAKQKALIAQKLAEQAKQEAELNKEECERRKAAQNAIEAVLEPEEEVYVPPPQTAGFKTIYFDFDESAIPSSAQADVLFNANIMKQRPQISVILASHTDERGTTEYNLALSQKRGESVKYYLQTLGVESSRMAVVPYGKEKPASYGTRDQDYALNRRVEFIER